MAKIPVVFEARLATPGFGELKFAFSPLWEVVASLRTLQAPGTHTLHLPWIKQARTALATSELDLTPALALVPPTGYIADFLTPPPSTPLPDLGDELAAVAVTPVELVRRNVDLLSRRTVDVAEPDRLRNWRNTLAADPGSHLSELVELLRAYWKLVIEPHWPRLRGLLEADVVHRSRDLALGGVRSLFAGLHPEVRWDDGTLSVVKKHQYSADVGSEGMLLVPCAFAWPSVLVMCEAPWPATVIYPPRGVATLWIESEAAPAGLAGALGRTRADILTALAGPTSTGELAVRLAVTPGAISQHLTALRGAGLVVSHRLGRRRVHVRTPVADALVVVSQE